MSTLKATNLQHASAASPAIVLASSGSATAQLSSINDGPIAGARNRIINGDMRIDQRNAGAAVTPTADPTFTIDRFYVGFSQASKITSQQETSIVPAGFESSLNLTVAAAVTPGANDFFIFGQPIEANNVTDLALGTANAKSFTLSFQVRSSVTGTYSGVIKNSAQNRSYPFTYSVSSANTWTSISVTIPGDTSGTWLRTGNGVGIQLQLCLGVGSTYSGTAGAWAGTNYVGSTGTTNWISTNGATFYITGVQLEPGSVATPFERRSYGQELMLCQRYHQKSYNSNVAIATNTLEGTFTYTATKSGTNSNQYTIVLPMTMRATPTVTFYTPSGVSGNVSVIGADKTIGYENSGQQSISFYVSGSVSNVGDWIRGHWTASAEL